MDYGSDICLCKLIFDISTRVFVVRAKVVVQAKFRKGKSCNQINLGQYELFV